MAVNPRINIKGVKPATEKKDDSGKLILRQMQEQQLINKLKKIRKEN